MFAAVRQGRLHDVMPVAGQSAGLIEEILSAGEIGPRIVAQAQRSLERSAQLVAT